VKLVHHGGGPLVLSGEKVPVCLQGDSYVLMA